MIEKSNYDRVLEVFFNDSMGKFYIREIARITGLNPNTIINITDRLLKEGLIKKEKKKHIVEFSANLNDHFKRLRRILNFYKIFNCGLIDFLNKEFDSEAIVLIGSYSRGEDIKDSDIDLVIISKKEYHNVDLKRFEKIFNKKIHLIVSYYNKMSDEFYINFINGLILFGYINKKEK